LIRAGLAAQRYAGKVGAYEIWNEPNAAPYYGPQPDPAGYTELLKAAYPAIKAADPDATVIGGVVGSTVTYENYTLNPVTFVDEMYQNGAQADTPKHAPKRSADEPRKARSEHPSASAGA
jgi:polysaccharide biosynthesis protein PslG